MKVARLKQSTTVRKVLASPFGLAMKLGLIDPNPRYVVAGIHRFLPSVILQRLTPAPSLALDLGSIGWRMRQKQDRISEVGIAERVERFWA